MTALSTHLPHASVPMITPLFMMPVVVALHCAQCNTAQTVHEPIHVTAVTSALPFTSSWYH